MHNLVTHMYTHLSIDYDHDSATPTLPGGENHEKMSNRWSGCPIHSWPPGLPGGS